MIADDVVNVGLHQGSVAVSLAVCNHNGSYNRGVMSTITVGDNLILIAWSGLELCGRFVKWKLERRLEVWGGCWENECGIMLLSARCGGRGERPSGVCMGVGHILVL